MRSKRRDSACAAERAARPCSPPASRPSSENAASPNAAGPAAFPGFVPRDLSRWSHAEAERTMMNRHSHYRIGLTDHAASSSCASQSNSGWASPVAPSFARRLDSTRARDLNLDSRGKCGLKLGERRR